MSGRTSVLLIAGLAALFLLSALMPWRALVALLAQDRELGLAALAQLLLPQALLALTTGAMPGVSGSAEGRWVGIGCVSTRCSLVTGVQTCALPICMGPLMLDEIRRLRQEMAA